MGVEIQSKRIRILILSLAQELRSTFGRMPNKVVVTSEQVVTIFMGQVVTDLLQLLNAELRQKYILHQFYILNFAFSYMMNTSLCQYPFFISSWQHLKTTYFSINFSFEQTGSIQIHSTLWLFKMSSAIDNTCSGNKKIVFKRKVLRIKKCKMPFYVGLIL